MEKNEKGLTISELADALKKTENNLRVQIHKRGILPVSTNPNRYDIADFEPKRGNTSKLKRLQKRVIELKAQLAVKDEIINTYLRRYLR